ncbi:MAG: High-affinity zinc uptake system membrane protein ZnuB [Lentisphaerae bacterium ADurb.BinA184]|nr:MAG: High-affinity zinc uptake system membrane protein ZnuB [Lentisphaerae bacterium ADurb.BinA184]
MTEFAAALFDAVGRLLPLPCMQARFMQQALVGLLLLAPLAAAMGVQVVNFRQAFFSDAISHSAFAGVAIGLLLSIDPRWTLPAFGILVGLGIVWVQRRSTLSADAVIGVFFSAAVAFGLAVVSRERGLGRDMQRFLYGDILTIGPGEIAALAVLAAVLMGFQIFAFNRLIYIGLNPVLAQIHRVRVAFYQYAFAALLSAVVVFSVSAVGVLLVTALLIVPGAAARNLARSAGGMFWWALGISLVSAVAGLLISAQEWARTATGATVILCACLWFAVSAAVAARRRRGVAR